ncbi:hypothetical protein C7271_23885, partial [filamentous cyanobacterium CCP5]
MSPSPFAHLRQTYPTAELCVALLTIHADKYVVQATIRADGSVLASALAADPVIEIAEDRACQRAIEKLGLDLPPPAADPQTPSPSLSAPAPPKLADLAPVGLSADLPASGEMPIAFPGNSSFAQEQPEAAIAAAAPAPDGQPSSAAEADSDWQRS